MSQLAVGPVVTQVWAGGSGQVTLANTDIANTVTIGRHAQVKIGGMDADPIPPLGAVTYDGRKSLYAIAPAGTSGLTILPGASSWSPSPAQIAAQIQLLGTPPSVPGSTSGSAILEPPGSSPVALFTFTSAGRIWGAAVSFAMGSSGGIGSNQGYAQVLIRGGASLVPCEACVVGNPDADSNSNALSFPGLQAPAGTVIQLDINGGNTISGVVLRGSGLVAVSIP